jgi:hypothetical protein
MAKKMRRARRPQPSQSFRPASSQSTPEAARPAPGTSPTAGNGKKVDFATEYFYVLHDLRTMGIIAASMLTVLIVLSFIIH